MYDEIIRICNATNPPQPFVDASFIPGPKSLGNLKTEQQTPYQWRRAKDIKSSWTVIRDNFDPTDIEQGELGDCWFLSALAVLSENPVLLEHLLLTKKYNATGAYQLMFCKSGHWTTVTIDDHFPITDWGGLAFSNAKRKQLWVPLIEKAYAKLYGSYEAIRGGHVHEALADLTGVPCESVRLDTIDADSDLIFARLVSFRQSGFLMGASCGNSEQNPQLFSGVGLRMNHAYSLLDVRIEHGHKLVKLRNPWGSFEWKGAWSDDSDEWKRFPDLKSKLNMHCDNNDGVFWMRFHDLLLYFRSVDVCKIRPSWYQLQIDGSWRKSSVSWCSDHMYELKVSKSTWITASLIQHSARGKGDNYQYRNTGLFVLKVDRGDPLNMKRHQLIGVAFPSRESQVHCEFNATDTDRSRYIVVPVSFDEAHHHVDSYALSIYTANPVLVRKIPPDIRYCRSAALLAVSESNDVKELYPGVQLISHKPKVGGVWFMVNNYDNKKNFQLDLEIEAEGLLSSRDGFFTVKATIPPLSRQIVMVLTPKDKYQGYQWKTSFAYRQYKKGLFYGNGYAHAPHLKSENQELHLHVPIF